MSKSKRNRTKKSVPAKPSQSQNQNSFTVKNQLVAEQFQGPVPHPNILAGYEEIHTGFAERIICLAEKETAHRHIMEKKALEAEISGLKSEAADTRIGQIFGLLIGLVTVLAGTYAAIHGAQAAGSLIGTSGVVGLVSAFIAGRKKVVPEHKANQVPKE